MNTGFILLYRQITDWEWYQNPNTFRVFLHILLKANFTEGRFEGRDIKRGQLVTSLDHLSKETRLTVKEVRTALNHLIGTGELASESCNRYRVITVVKYDEYQSEGKQNGKQMASKGQAKGKQEASKGQQYNNDKKGTMEQGNNDNNNITPLKRFTPPTVDDVRAYLDERGVWLIDPERFVDYYAVRNWELSKGRKMKDWKAAVRLWEKNERDRQKERNYADSLPF